MHESHGHKSQSSHLWWVLRQHTDKQVLVAAPNHFVEVGLAA